MSFSHTSPQAPPRRQQNASWLTVGVKLLVGVALASNGCIGTLLLLNHQSTQKVAATMTEVRTIRDQVDVSLRDAIVQLQQEFVQLPHLFVLDPTQAILRVVEDNFTIRERLRLVGRDQYGPRFSRAEKRDLAKGKLVTGVENGVLLLSHGRLNEQGEFTEEIEQLVLASEQPEADQQRLHAVIAAEEGKAGSSLFYEDRISQLRALAADKSLEAERSRTQILGFVDRINGQQQQMEETMRRQQRQNFLAGLATIVVNVVVLVILTRLIVERPLRRLTGIVEALGQGQYPEIPWRNRRDQIGVLCAAIARFREALLQLNQEEQRKLEDRRHIEEAVVAMSETIHVLDGRAGEMAQVALSLQELAGRSEQASTNVSVLADDTARRTVAVSESSSQISAAVNEIHRELGVQNTAVTRMGSEIGQARQQLDELSRSVGEIDTIVGTVQAITDQTKILAINATIEAVKAGVYGRGFAVVADEVKKLSLDTALATKDILEKIEAINLTCRIFIDTFDSLEQGADALHRVTASIDAAVGRQHQLAGQIVHLSGATGENTRDVSSRIAEVNTVAGGVLQLAGNTRQLAEEIAKQLGQLLSGNVRQLGHICQRHDDSTMADCSVGSALPVQQPVAPQPRSQRTEQHGDLCLLHDQGILEGK